MTARITEKCIECGRRLGKDGRCPGGYRCSLREQTGRITTRAGRKIRHVAPGHVVDVATGLVLHRVEGPGVAWGVDFDHQLLRGPRAWDLESHLRYIAIAAGICALVRALIEAWQFADQELWEYAHDPRAEE